MKSFKLMKDAEMQELMKIPLLKAIFEQRVIDIDRLMKRFGRKGFIITVKEPK